MALGGLEWEAAHRSGTEERVVSSVVWDEARRILKPPA